MKIAYLILAAGQASRFGSSKQLARLPSGQSIIEHAISQTPAQLREDSYVVVGAYRDEIIPLLEGTNVIVHENWADGLGRSLAFGVAHVLTQGDYDAILVGLADQVGVGAQELEALLAAYVPGKTVCARYAGQRGVPALFSKEMFARLTALSGDRGAKKLLMEAGADVIELDLPAAQFDIDTVSDLAAYVKTQQEA